MTDSAHDLPIALNLLDRQTTVAQLDWVWGATLPTSPPTKVGCFWPW
jgi:hypothetical protein